MSLATFLLFAQLAAPLAPARPVLSFPERGLDDPAAYAGYQTRLFRDAAGNTLQIYLDSRAQRVVHLWADAEDESIGFTARGRDGRGAVLSWNGDAALVGRTGRARVVEYSLVADDQRIVVGWFLLGTMRVERDLQYGGQQKAAFSNGPFVVAETDRLLAALARLDAPERARQLALLHAASLDELRARRAPTIVASASTVRIVQPTLDALDTLTLELRADPSRVAIEAAGDSATLRARSGSRIPFTVRITTTGRTLTPIRREEIFTPSFLDYLAATRADAARAGAPRDVVLGARRTERQVRGLELLVSHEKLMAGLPTYATYFGRDMLMSTLMLRPVWKPAMSEFAIASALRKLSPEGRVSHEEALGGQAVREAASEYATLVDSALASPAGPARDALLERARVVLRDIRRVRENYHMIDAEFQLPILEARWLRDPAVSDARKREFLLDASDGEPRVVRVLRELALLAEVTAPYAHDPVSANLVSFAPRDSGRWGSQSWRDSEVGYARGRYAMDVNAIWAPHALEATAQILDALRPLGLLGDTLVRRAAPKGDESALVAYVRDPAELRTAIERWQGASRHFVVRLGPGEVRERVRARLAAMPEGERGHWNAVLAATGADRDSLVFLALSLDAQGRPIGVANSDVATRLFLGETEGPSRTPSAAERDAVLRDVRTFVRHYPVGLLIDGVGPVVASDAYAPPSVWADFERDRYHGPRVVWGRENNLFLLGTMQRVTDAGAAPELAAYRRELTDAIAQVRAAVDASGFHSELWSYELRNGRIVPMRYGSGSDVQLWSTTDLAVGFARRAMPRSTSVGSPNDASAGSANRSSVGSTNSATIADTLTHPVWSRNADIYEVNVRQFTPQGTLAGVQTQLPRLKALGVDIIWLMPVQPIGMKNRKGPLGSYYSIRDYTAVNPELGTMADFNALVAAAHRLGIKVLLDWVPNHTAFDHPWTTAHKDYYVTRADGTIINARDNEGHDTDWTDVAELNYDNPALRSAMIDAMRWWLVNGHIDGFRNDVAGGVPLDFWMQARAALQKTRPDLFMLAEAEDPRLHAAFDMTYGWELHHLMNDVAQGKKPVEAFDAYFARQDSLFGRGAYRMYFTSNHDENSWNGSEFERMGANALPMYVLAATVRGSMPLLYTGQEVSLKKRLRFFEKDTVDWGGPSLAPFYHAVFDLKHHQPALANGAFGGTQTTLHTTGGDRVYAFERVKGNNVVVVALNFGDAPVSAAYQALSGAGSFTDWFSRATVSLPANGTIDIPAHGYRVLVR